MTVSVHYYLDEEVVEWLKQGAAENKWGPSRYLNEVLHSAALKSKDRAHTQKMPRGKAAQRKMKPIFDLMIERDLISQVPEQEVERLIIQSMNIQRRSALVWKDKLVALGFLCDPIRIGRTARVIFHIEWLAIDEEFRPQDYAPVLTVEESKSNTERRWSR